MEALGGGEALGVTWSQRANYHFSIKTTHYRPQTTRTLSHALRASAVADNSLTQADKKLVTKSKETFLLLLLLLLLLLKTINTGQLVRSDLAG